MQVVFRHVNSAFLLNLQKSEQKLHKDGHSCNLRIQKNIKVYDKKYSQISLEQTKMSISADYK